MNNLLSATFENRFPTTIALIPFLKQVLNIEKKKTNSNLLRPLKLLGEFTIWWWMIITTAQLYSKPELRFYTGSNPARDVSEIHDGENLWQWSRLEIRLNAFRRSTIPQKHHHHHHHHHHHKIGFHKNSFK